MVRLTAVNFLFSANEQDDVFLGNSIRDDSPISRYDGKVDLILTNPPFGARFAVQDLNRTSRKSVPFFARSSAMIKVVDSEVLFLDRYLTMLKPGGVCLAVVPDGVISAKGASAIVRQHLARTAEIMGIVELPPVAFAQAGTRTKTAVLAFRKVHCPKRRYPVFFGEAADLGFQVSKRKGVAIRRKEGVNQLPDILHAFESDWEAVNRKAATVRAAWSDIKPNELAAWTPRGMLLDRKSLECQARGKLVPLREFVETRRKRATQAYQPVEEVCSLSAAVQAAWR